MKYSEDYRTYPKYNQAHMLASPPWFYFAYSQPVFFTFCKFCQGPFVTPRQSGLPFGEFKHKHCSTEFEELGHVKTLKVAKITKNGRYMEYPVFDLKDNDLFSQLSNLV